MRRLHISSTVSPHEDQAQASPLSPLSGMVDAPQAGQAAAVRSVRESVLGPATDAEGKVIRTYRYPLLPTRRQERVLGSWFGSCQRLYNAALEQRISWWRQSRTSLSLYDQTKELTGLRAEDAEYARVPVEIARSALKRLDRAFQAFFRRVKRGETPGFPRFRAHHRYRSFGIGRASVTGDRVRVPKLGLVRFCRYRDLDGEIRDVEIRRSAKRWWVCIVVDMGAAPTPRPVRSVVGIDLGLTDFATLSTGETISNPRHFRTAQRTLKRRQQAFARKRKGSANRAKARQHVALMHERVQNQRRDFHCKVAADLVGRFDLVAHEALNVKGLSRSRLAKSVHDAGWSAFLGRLACKAESAGTRVIPVDPRGTTQNCSDCGAVVRKGLGDRLHSCPCGAVLGRDHNAALNILARGRRAAACGGDVSPIGFGRDAAPVKQEVLGACRRTLPKPCASKRRRKIAEAQLRERVRRPA